MAKEIRYWTYEKQVEQARFMGYSVSWLRQELRAIAEYQGHEVVFQHKPRTN